MPTLIRSRSSLPLLPLAPLLATLLAAPLLLLPGTAAADCGSNPERGVNWQGCRKRSLILSGYDLSQGKFAGADFQGSDLRKAAFEGTDFSKAALGRTNLAGSRAAGANFSKAEGARAVFDATDLRQSDFSKAMLARVSFRGADLSGASLRKGEFSRADFREARLDNVDLSYLQSQPGGLSRRQPERRRPDDLVALPCRHHRGGPFECEGPHRRAGRLGVRRRQHEASCGRRGAGRLALRRRRLTPIAATWMLRPPRRLTAGSS